MPSDGIRSKIAISYNARYKMKAFDGILILKRGKKATTWIACMRPHRRLREPMSKKFIKKLVPAPTLTTFLEVSTKDSVIFAISKSLYCDGSKKVSLVSFLILLKVFSETSNAGSTTFT